jgi:hypothetical protein
MKPMLRLPSVVVGNCPFFFLLLLVTCFVHPALAQLETATVSGQVVDPSGLGVTGAHVKLVDIDRDTTTSAATNNSGLYTFASVRPGRYRLEVNAAGFRMVNVTGLTLNVQDHIEQNFRLQIGSVAESVTVEASAQQVNTTDATVSTVVDRQFAENLPMNGRSFQSLIELAPGVVVTPSSLNDSGQFSVNGQRANSNYWMVDGVSANFGVNAYVTPGNGFGGTLGSFSALGGTNSLVSVDALQEFRIETSTYAPEFGRTPGAQISIVTRSGTNQFHGTIFDYFRNDVLDANDWFNGYTNNPPLHKARERQNDFGGTFSGPIAKNRTFFFFSYEGLRLQLPNTALTTVPDLSARQNAMPALQPYLNAFPRPNGPEDPANPGAAQFNASYSNPASLDAYSLRIDHKLNDKLSLFGRYDYSPSELIQRGNGQTLNTVATSRITTQTMTVGAPWLISPAAANDFRLNYSRTVGSTDLTQDNFGGAVPLATLPFPAGFTNQNAQFGFAIFSLASTGVQFSVGNSGYNLQRQINIVDQLSLQRGSHSIKFGIDFRRLSPISSPYRYLQSVAFNDVPSAELGQLGGGFVLSDTGVTLALHNLGTFAQDTWRLSSRFTLTYGLRWDIDLVPATINGPAIPAVTGYNLNDLSALSLAPTGTPPYKTTFANLAPRLGLAYQLSQSPARGTVLRGGVGKFYDLATGELGSLVGIGLYPYGGFSSDVGGTFPLDSVSALPPPIRAVDGIAAIDPKLKLPYSLEWNVALEQSLGTQQTISASYVGSVGRRLLQTAFVIAPNPNYAQAQLLGNSASSEYNSLQIQFQRRLSRGLQALASYTWAHSIDTASAGSAFGNEANTLVPGIDPNANRGPSDFDIRSAFSGAVTYDIPVPHAGAATRAILGGWSLQNIVQARSATPVNVVDNNFLELFAGLTSVRPDVISGQPYYLYGAQCAASLQVPVCPGGKAVNPAAFTNPPVDPNTGNPLRQGDLGRNALRGFGALQWDFALHRDFPIHDRFKLQFRSEFFNVLNHPNFGPPNGAFGFPGFGLSTQTLAQSLGGSNLGNGGFDPLYQLGGPRSLQLALKVLF